MIESEHKKINPEIGYLYNDAMHNKKYNMSSTGALLAYSGTICGRCPQNKRIVKDDNTKNIWWGNVNIPIENDLYQAYKTESINYLKNHNNLYELHLYAGWDASHKIKIILYTTNPYHALFLKDLLIPTDEIFESCDFTIYDTSELSLSSIQIDDTIELDPKLKDTLVGLNFTDMSMLIYGTEYAGEIKKGILTLMMYLMPLKGFLPLHSSANINGDNLALFFGLSGTGKTTLSADPNRNLIGDDEHVWTNTGVFNIEGGCYAKCINLNPKNEPDIYNAIKYGSVLENVVHDQNFVVNYDNCAITENTRCAYPLSYINNAIIPAVVDVHPINVIFLTCDSFGLLPPIAKLSYEQAIDFFIAGYTSKVAGTEVGITEPVAVFSACFGEPFLVWHPKRYGELLKLKLDQHKPNIWILNTGWVNGPYGTGKRISISTSRQILNDIHSGSLIQQNFVKFPVFNFEIPTSFSGQDNSILDPRNTFPNTDKYIDQLQTLHNNIYKKINSL